MLSLSHPIYGTIHLRPSTVRLTEVIRQKLSLIQEVRFQLSEGWQITSNKTGRDLSQHPLFFTWMKVEIMAELNTHSDQLYRLYLNGIDTRVQAPIC